MLYNMLSNLMIFVSPLLPLHALAHFYSSKQLKEKILRSLFAAKIICFVVYQPSGWWVHWEADLIPSIVELCAMEKLIKLKTIWPTFMHDDNYTRQKKARKKVFWYQKILCDMKLFVAKNLCIQKSAAQWRLAGMLSQGSCWLLPGCITSLWKSIGDSMGDGWHHDGDAIVMNVVDYGRRRMR